VRVLGLTTFVRVLGLLTFVRVLGLTTFVRVLGFVPPVGLTAVLLGCTRAGGVVVRCTGRAAGWTGLGAGAGLAGAGAGLLGGGGGGLFLFLSPAGASTGTSIMTKSTINISVILFFDMFKLLTIS